MQRRFSGRSAVFVAGLFAAFSAVASKAPAAEPALRAAITIDAATRFQRIDGFGVNLTPAQWRGGVLKPTLDLLVDDLGTSLVRLDCYGKADWLDPAKRDADGRWPEAYLAGVYRSQVFVECWDTFRHLAAKGADVHLNVSGRVPAAWTGPDGQTLVDFDAYAEMAVSLARWAREKEGLRFATFAPFNETNLGFPEGPKVRDVDVLPAVRAVAKGMEAAGLGDVKLVVACDAPPVAKERFTPMLEAPDLVGRVAAFSTHTYGDGDEGDATPGWHAGESERAALVKAVAASPHAGASLWMTEYGDLDQTGLIEWQFAWRSARRLMRVLADGFHAALAWDAFDNLHEHDGVWATYGLLRTDRYDLDARAEEALLRGEAGVPLRPSRLASRRGDAPDARPEGRLRRLARPDAPRPAPGLHLAGRPGRDARGHEPGRGRRRARGAARRARSRGGLGQAARLLPDDPDGGRAARRGDGGGRRRRCGSPSPKARSSP